MRRLLSILFALFALVLASPSLALHVERDYLEPGDGLITLDKDTGLYWLDVTYTVGLSYNDVVNGPLYEAGWRHANMDQLCALALPLLGVGPGCDALIPNGNLTYIVEGSDALLPLIQLLGVTFAQATIGLREGSYTTQIVYNTGEVGIAGSRFTHVLHAFDPDSTTGPSGHFLVMTPEPGTLLMVGLGLAGLARAGRRR